MQKGTRHSEATREKMRRAWTEMRKLKAGAFHRTRMLAVHEARRQEAKCQTR